MAFLASIQPGGGEFAEIKGEAGFVGVLPVVQGNG